MNQSRRSGPSDAKAGQRPGRRSLVLGGMVGLLLLAGSAARAEGAAPTPHSTSPNLGEPLKPSTAEQLQLGDFLRRQGILFYGAWWCPACFRQKSLFGQEAGQRLPYVECEKTDAGRERCRADGIKAYPTWVKGGERLEGVQTLEELKTWSGYGKGGGTAAP